MDQTPTTNDARIALLQQRIDLTNQAATSMQALIVVLDDTGWWNDIANRAEEAAAIVTVADGLNVLLLKRFRINVEVSRLRSGLALIYHGLRATAAVLTIEWILLQPTGAVPDADNIDRLDIEMPVYLEQLRAAVQRAAEQGIV